MIVYRYKNTIDNKLYYGQTIGKLENRHKAHLRAVRAGSQAYLHRAMRSHGIECFVLEEVERCTSKQQLDERETYYILRDKTNIPEFGYNMTEGGEGTVGWVPTKQNRKNMSKNHADVSGENNPRFNKPVLRETRDKIGRSNSIVLKGKKKSKKHSIKIGLALSGKSKSKEHIENWMKSMEDKRNWHTEYHKKNQSKKMSGKKNPMYGKSAVKGRIWINNNEEDKMIPKEQFITWKNLGWFRGRTRVSCNP